MRPDRSEHFDAIIIGSGFGGSVMAYRLAEAGLRVCVLERGKAYPPGAFPRSPYAMRRNFWDPEKGLHGLYHLYSFTGLGAVTASGLGGGSLIYANVLLRKDEKTFIHEDLEHGGYEDWPITREDLEPHYDLVERMMGAQRYPFEHEPYASTSKTRAMQQAAHALGKDEDWMLPPLAVTFANPGAPPVPGEPIREAHPNLHGRTRDTCRLCGECDIGCNFGSKNTLDYTYLSAAARLGAELRTRADVRALKPVQGGGYVVEYLDYTDAPGLGPCPDAPPPPRRSVTAERVILSAGTLGSTDLLLRNRKFLPGLSPALGARFCGNGDLLGFMLKCMEHGTNGDVPRILDGGRGPVITSALRFRGQEDGGTGRGYYIEDAGFPEFANWLYEGAHQLAVVSRMARLAARIALGWVRIVRDTDVSWEIAQVLGDCTGSASSLPLLAMGRDAPDGLIHHSKDGRLQVDWSMRKGSRGYFERVQRTMRDIADALDGELESNPLSKLSRVITVHPLGGCPMAVAPELGVVDAEGQVFNHPGLYVADGSVMPGPVGANPSLTIAAVADRFADHLIEGLPSSRRPSREPRPAEEPRWQEPAPSM